MFAAVKEKKKMDIDDQSDEGGVGRRRSGRSRRPPTRFGEQVTMSDDDDDNEVGYYGEDGDDDDSEDAYDEGKKKYASDNADDEEEEREMSEGDGALRRPRRERSMRDNAIYQSRRKEVKSRGEKRKRGPNIGKKYKESYAFGTLPDGAFVVGKHGDDREVIRETERFAKLLFEQVKDGKKRATIITNDEERKAYLPSESSTPPPASFLEPTRTEEEEDDVVIRSERAVDFTEAMPNAGERIEILMGGSEGGDEKTIKLDRFASCTLNEALQIDEKPGCLLNVGSNVYSLDWRPTQAVNVMSDDEYLCVAAGLTAWPRTRISERVPPQSSPATVQIWSVSRFDWSSKCEMVLCFDGGRIASVRWAPILRPISEGKVANVWMGFLAVAMQDGSVGVYAVPLPDMLYSKTSYLDVLRKPLPIDSSSVPYLRLTPLARLDARHGVPLCMEWREPHRLAIGYSDGYLAVWDVRDTFDAEYGDPLNAYPQLYVRVSGSPLSGVAWGAEEDEGSLHVYSSAYDGSVYATSLAHPEFSTTVNHTRDSASCVAVDSTSGRAIFEELGDTTVRILEYMEGKTGSRGVYPHFGRVRCLSTSAYHPFCASGSADGSVRVANIPMLYENARRWQGAGVNVVFRLEVTDRSKGTLRFVDNVHPTELSRYPPDTFKEDIAWAQRMRFGLTMGWHPALCVNAVRWNDNYSHENWLASGMSAGLVRVDVVGTPAKTFVVEDDTDTE